MSVGKGPGFDFEDGKIIRRQEEDEKDELSVSSGTESAIMLENYRESRARKIAIKRTFAVCIIAFVVLLIIAAAVFMFFRINEVNVTGSARYGEQELVSALGLNPYSNILFTGKGKLEQRLRDKYPSLDDITIEKKLPDKLIITVSDGVGSYYMFMGGDYYVLTDTLRIIERTGTPPDGCVELISCDVLSAITGDTLTFRTSTHYNYLCGLLSVIREHPSGGHIVRVDMNEKFNVKLTYDDRFTIVLGDADDAGTKLNLAENIISTLSATEKGIIDTSDIEKCSYRKTDDIS